MSIHKLIYLLCFLVTYSLAWYFFYCTPTKIYFHNSPRPFPDWKCTKQKIQTIGVRCWRDVGGQDPSLLDQVLPELEYDEPAEEQDGPDEAEEG